MSVQVQAWPLPAWLSNDAQDTGAALVPKVQLVDFLSDRGRDEFDRHAVFKALRMHKLPPDAVEDCFGARSKANHIADQCQAEPWTCGLIEAADAPERCQSPDMPVQSRALSGPAKPEDSQPMQLPEALVSAACLQALMGSTAVMPQMLQPQVCTDSIRPLALHRLTQVICAAGLRRAQLEGFVQYHGSPGLQHPVDAVRRAFVQAVGAVLDHHTHALAGIGSEISSRREAELRCEDPEALPSAPPAPTPLEIFQHTRQLRKQLHTLAHLCWCSAGRHSSQALRWQEEAYPAGNALLELLYDGPLFLLTSLHDRWLLLH